MTQALKIVLTNDDGYSAPGIQSLYAALVSAGFDVHIVAPAVNQSAQGSSLGGAAALASPIAFTQFSPGNYDVDGRPATAALTALDDLFAGDKPDLVISGTNRGDNIGESENISGTVNGALQGLFEGVPAIAVSAGSSGGSYTAAFGNAANFVVDLLHKLQAAQTPGQPILPSGQALSINVPGNPLLGGIAVTTTTAESSASFPYAPTGAPNTYAEGFVPNTAPSGSPTAEGTQFLTNHITITPIDGNWGGTAADRTTLAARLGSSISSATAGRPLNILLLNEDGYGSTGINATRDALLAKGYNVTVLAPTSDQSAVGSALTLTAVTVTQYDASDYAATGTPASLVSLGLDPMGLFGGARPDLVVVGADQGDAVGIENANHSATLGGAITALFNYGVPSIAVNAKSGSTADLTTAANFVTAVIANLQATQGGASSILPPGIGLSINVPTGATAGNFAVTTIDNATDANLSVSGNGSQASFGTSGVVVSSNPNSEGNAFNAGKITISPIDGSTAVRDASAYTALAGLLGTTYGTSTAAPSVLTFTVSEDAYQGDAMFKVLVNGRQIGGAQTVTASHAAGQTQTVTVLDYFDAYPNQITLQYFNAVSGGTAATSRTLYVDAVTLNGRVFQAEQGYLNNGIRQAADVAFTGNGALTVLARLPATGPDVTITSGSQVAAFDALKAYKVTLQGASAGDTATLAVNSVTFGSGFSLQAAGLGSTAGFGTLAATGLNTNAGTIGAVSGAGGGKATLAITLADQAGAKPITGTLNNTGTITAGFGSEVDLTGTVDSKLINTGHLISNGMMFIGTTIMGTGSITIGSHTAAPGTLEVGGKVSTGQSIDLEAGRLVIDNAKIFAATVFDFDARDQVVLKGADISNVTYKNGALLLDGGAGGTLHFHRPDGVAYSSASFQLQHAGADTIITTPVLT